MGKTVHTEAVRDLFEAILTLETEEECFNFFEDVCTVNELLSIAQRSVHSADCCCRCTGLLGNFQISIIFL